MTDKLNVGDVIYSPILSIPSEYFVILEFLPPVRWQTRAMVVKLLDSSGHFVYYPFFRAEWRRYDEEQRRNDQEH